MKPSTVADLVRNGTHTVQGAEELKAAGHPTALERQHSVSPPPVPGRSYDANILKILTGGHHLDTHPMHPCRALNEGKTDMSKTLERVPSLCEFHF